MESLEASWVDVIEEAYGKRDICVRSHIDNGLRLMPEIVRCGV